MNRLRAKYIPLGLLVVAGVLAATPVYGQAEAADTSGIEITGEYGPFLPTDVSVHGHQIDSLIDIVHWFMAFLFVGWGSFFIYCLFKFRQKPGQTAVYAPVKAKLSKYLEIAVVVFEAFLLLGLSMPIWGAVKNNLPTDEDNPVRIRVLAEQFQWNFHYPGNDGVFGRTGPEFIDLAMNPVGKDPSDPNGNDDVVSAQMHIPVGRPVICEVGSKDVIHSFAIPVMRVKQDTIPGMRIPVWFQTKEGTNGNYEIACAQLCGNNHYTMRALLVIEEQAEFDAWLIKEGTVEEFDEDDLD